MRLPPFRELPADTRSTHRTRLLAEAAAPAERRWTRVAAVGAAAAALAGVLALVPSRFAEEEQVGLLEGAAAVVSGGPVIHVLIENEDSRAFLVDLESGEETVEPERYEYWHDVRSGDIHARLTIGSEVLNEWRVVQDPDAPPVGVRELTFANRYREALAAGRARVVRRETVGGRRVALLRIEVEEGRDPRSGRPLHPAYTEEVYVDEKTHEPVRFRRLPGRNTVPGPIHWWRVLEIESIARDDGDFEVDRPSFEWTTFAPGMTRKATPDEAVAHLGRPVLWPGTDVAGVPLESLRTGVTDITWRDGRTTTSPSLTYEYESEREGTRDWITISVGTAAAETPRYGPVDGEHVPAGKVRLSFVPTRDDESISMWFGNVERDGLYFNMQSPSRELIVAAARSLRPLE